MEEKIKVLKNVLIIRADNMGDLLMSVPAIRAVRETYGSRITVLTSKAATSIAKDLSEIDDVITYDLPWVKNESVTSEDGFFEIAALLRSKRFDAAIIMTVYSQNPLPAAMLAYLAGIPIRLGYCRENPYKLLTHWVPDEEPYSTIKHQVRRDLDLVAKIGATTGDERLRLNEKPGSWAQAKAKVEALGVDMGKPWLILHPGVSEKKREFPVQLWIECARRLAEDFQLLFTGGAGERVLTDQLAKETGVRSYSLAGELNLDEFAALIKHSPLVVSVNTGTIHLAAAVDTPVIVLYALTNPQHLPWKVKGKAFLFDVPPELRSKNEVIRYVSENLHPESQSMIEPDQVVQAVYEILSGKGEVFPEMLPLREELRQSL